MEVPKKMTIEYQNIHGNRKYKDSLFRMVFRRKEDLLDLYNAINGTNYTDALQLEINTIENVLYISMKNDVSFMIDGTMNLYEHQSSKNENMPLRGFLYFAKLFEKYLAEHDLDIYNSRIQKIPTPKYIVFYNGKSNEPDERIIRLSDAFEKKDGCVECEARLLNINYGRNRELMEKCRRLEEYSIFVATVRACKKENVSLMTAVTQAIDDCIEKGILVDILKKQRSEVLEVVLTTFNQELYEKNLKQDAFDEGCAVGERQKLKNLVQRKLAKGNTVEEIAEWLEEDIELIKELKNELE